MIAELGLIVIILAWTIQIYYGRKINKRFVVIYGAGVLLLVLDGLQSRLYTLAILNLVSFVTALFLLIRLKGGKNAG